jgi:uncharacterized protein
MFRQICAVFYVLVLCAASHVQAQTIPELTSPVVDVTHTLTAVQQQKLEQQALDLQQRKGSQLQVLIVPSTGPDDIFIYSQRVFEQWKLGRQGADDGVLLVVAKADRRMRIHVGYGLEGVIPDATASRVIQEYMAPKFKEGDYFGGIRDATNVLGGLIDGESLPPLKVDGFFSKKGLIDLYNETRVFRDFIFEIDTSVTVSVVFLYLCLVVFIFCGIAAIISEFLPKGEKWEVLLFVFSAVLTPILSFVCFLFIGVIAIIFLVGAIIFCVTHANDNDLVSSNDSLGGNDYSSSSSSSWSGGSSRSSGSSRSGGSSRSSSSSWSGGGGRSGGGGASGSW